MSGLLSNVFRFVGRSLQQTLNVRQFHAIQPTVSTTLPTGTTPWSFNSLRFKMRDNFPKASERKRLKTHGWRVRLQTKNGRRVIMRRILKGRYYLAH